MLAESKRPYSPSAEEPAGDVRKGRAREGSDEGPSGRSLSVPPGYEDSTVNKTIIYITKLRRNTLITISL